MSDPEPDDVFRERLLRVVNEDLHPILAKATGPALDIVGRQYGRFRTGVPLKGLEARAIAGIAPDPIRRLIEDALKAKRS